MVAWARPALFLQFVPSLCFPAPPPFFSVFCLLPVSLCLASPFAVLLPSPCPPCRLLALAISDAALPASPLDMIAFLHEHDLSFVGPEYLLNMLASFDRSSNPAPRGGVGPLNTRFASDEYCWMRTR